MKEDKDKFNNAVQILERTKEIIIDLTTKQMLWTKLLKT
jgi:hypothetical protein